jgi:hypothetical protein
MALHENTTARLKIHGVDMTRLNHECENCGSQFTIIYDEELCESDPISCPFCQEYLLLDSDEFTDDE